MLFLDENYLFGVCLVENGIENSLVERNQNGHDEIQSNAEPMVRSGGRTVGTKRNLFRESFCCREIRENETKDGFRTMNPRRIERKLKKFIGLLQRRNLTLKQNGRHRDRLNESSARVSSVLL